MQGRTSGWDEWVEDVRLEVSLKNSYLKSIGHCHPLHCRAKQGDAGQAGTCLWPQAAWPCGQHCVVVKYQPWYLHSIWLAVFWEGENGGEDDSGREKNIPGSPCWGAWRKWEEARLQKLSSARRQLFWLRVSLCAVWASWGGTDVWLWFMYWGRLEGLSPYSWCQSLLAEVTLTQTPVPAPTSRRRNIPGTCHIWHSVLFYDRFLCLGLEILSWPRAWVLLNRDNFPWTLVPETDVLEKCTFVSCGFVKY